MHSVQVPPAIFLWSRRKSSPKYRSAGMIQRCIHDAEGSRSGNLITLYALCVERYSFTPIFPSHWLLLLVQKSRAALRFSTSFMIYKRRLVYTYWGFNRYYGNRALSGDYPSIVWSMRLDLYTHWGFRRCYGACTTGQDVWLIIRGTCIRLAFLFIVD